MSAFTIATTVRVPPKTLAILAKGLLRISPACGRFRSPASIVKASCEVLESIMVQKFPELADMTAAEISVALMSANSLDSECVNQAIAEQLANVMEEIPAHKILEAPKAPKAPETPMCESDAIHKVVDSIVGVKQKEQIGMTIPKNFLIDTEN